MSQKLQIDLGLDIEGANSHGARLKLEELFMNWLSLDTTHQLVCSYLQDAKNGLPINIPTNHFNSLPRSPPARKATQHIAFGSFESPTNKESALKQAQHSPNLKNSAMDIVRGCASDIPKFYVPGEGGRGRGRALIEDNLPNRKIAIDETFDNFPDGITVDEFVGITKDLCGFPSFFNAPLFKRILESCKIQNSSRIKLEDFRRFWVEEIQPYDHMERFFRLVKQPQNDYITQNDFSPFLHELLLYHPGLEFLNGTPEFQEKYGITVVVRIFYSVDRKSSGRITLRDIRRSNLVEAFNYVDEEEDINKVNSYFSYEHFYVLYCKFWELDTDHDFLISRDDLMRYGGHSLTRAIVDRVFDHGRRPFGRMQTLDLEQRERMSYEDFIYFMLSEEDKGNAISLSYWFCLIDLNEDDVIRMDEMRYFYNEQMHRTECLGHEVVPFADVVCQMSDLLCPDQEGEFVFENFIKPDKIRISGVFFNVLFNLNKFIAFEHRDPFLVRQQMAEPQLTDWDRYARAEYARLALEEESRDEEGNMEIDSMDGWYVSEEENDEEDIHVNNSLARSTTEAPF